MPVAPASPGGKTCEKPRLDKVRRKARKATLCTKSLKYKDWIDGTQSGKYVVLISLSPESVDCTKCKFLIY